MTTADKDDAHSSPQWSAFTFHTQLLPRTVPVAVHVMERFDVERAARHRAARAAIRRSLSGLLTCPSCGHDLAAPARAAVHEVPAEPDAGPAVGEVGRAVPDAVVTGTVQGRMRMLTEAIAGRRPLSQLAGVADVAVLRYARVEAERLRGTRQPSRLRSVHVTEVAPGAVELCGLVELGGVTLAYASRVERHDGVWTITVLRILRTGRTAALVGAR